MAWLLVVFVTSSMLVASTERNESSRALKIYLVRQAASRTRNVALSQLALVDRQTMTDLVVGRIEQILAEPLQSNSMENEVEDNYQIELYHGSRRHLKMGSKGRKGRSRKRRYRGKGKTGMMSKGMKGMGKSKREKSESGKGGGKGNLKDICADLDFSAFYGIDSSSSVTSVFGGSYGKGKSGKGKSWRSRSLQFDGELCSPNALEVARMDPDLSIFVDLVEAVNLSDIFLCAVSQNCAIEQLFLTNADLTCRAPLPFWLLPTRRSTKTLICSLHFSTPETLRSFKSCCCII